LVLGLAQKFKVSFLAVAFFQISVSSGFQQASFQVWLFHSISFFSSAKFQVGFVEPLKLASRFLACVSVSVGFDWLCFVASALFVAGLVGSQNRLVFFLQKFWQVEFVKLSWLRWLCGFLTKSSFPKSSFWFICGFDWQSPFFQQAFRLIIAFGYSWF